MVLYLFRWLFYDNYEYNLNKGGKVYWMHGIDFCGDLPRDYSDMVSFMIFLKLILFSD